MSDDIVERLREHARGPAFHGLSEEAADEIERLRRCVLMAMGCLDPLSIEPDDRLAWYRLKDALDGKEPREGLTQ